MKKGLGRSALACGVAALAMVAGRGDASHGAQGGPTTAAVDLLGEREYGRDVGWVWNRGVDAMSVGGAGRATGGAPLPEPEAPRDGGAEAETTHPPRRAHTHAPGPRPMDVRAAIAVGAAGAGGVGDTAAWPAIAIPHDTDPYDALGEWPLSLGSETLPIRVRHRPGEGAHAQRILGLLERGWRRHLDLGFRPPPLAPGHDAYDVFIWCGMEEVSVVARDENTATAWNDACTYMIVDPEGPYGGENLEHTMVHEVNHVFQAADDWYEFPSAFEGSATFIEWHTEGLNDQLREVMADFQARPHWSPDRNDDAETWFTYGYAMYLRFVQHTYAGGDPTFLGRAWEAARGAPGAEDDPARNEADLIDALGAVLPGFDYAASAVRFARWRWYTGARADDAHDPDAARLPEVPAQRAALGARGEVRVALDPAPQMLGSSFVELRAEGAGGRAVHVSLDAPARPGVRYVVQVVPGPGDGTDGEVLDISSGGATLRLPDDGSRTVIVTAVPDGAAGYDPDTRTDAAFPATLVMRAADR
jgi:hypothetical protein